MKKCCLAGCAAMLFAAGCSFEKQEAASRASSDRPTVMAVYYPHWHVYPKGNAWFHPGWTEWEYVKSAIPRFAGHHQPIVPKFGYLDGQNPDDVAREIDLAADAGIDVFLYDYYYYNGETTQEEAIEKGFLKAKNNNRMKFALMWCYHERTMGWRKKLYTKPARLMSLAHTTDEFLGLVDLSIRRYFKTPQYWRHDGRLFFSIYNAKDFIRSVGEESARQALAEARRRVRAAGLGEIEFNAQNPWTMEIAQSFKRVGFDSMTHYNGGSVRNADKRYAAGEQVFDYAETTADLAQRYKMFERGPLPYYPTVATGWDASPRCRLDEPFPWRADARGVMHGDYPYGNIQTNATPALFERNLRQARDFARRDGASGVVYINAWNEYTEGCYLMPDQYDGDGKLRAIERVFGVRP